ncbi:unnamed protein product, partial [Amoebophrya sp. A120]|eukprot:GSA120T00014207001.1
MAATAPPASLLPRVGARETDGPRPLLRLRSQRLGRGIRAPASIISWRCPACRYLRAPTSPGRRPPVRPNDLSSVHLLRNPCHPARGSMGRSASSGVADPASRLCSFGPPIQLL